LRSLKRHIEPAPLRLCVRFFAPLFGALSVFLLFIIFFSSCKKKEGDVIADIQKTSAEINKKLKKYTVKHTDDLTTRDGGSITGYYRDDEAKKIYTEHFADNGRTFSEYYFDDGLMIQIVKQEFTYNRPRSYTEEKARKDNDSEWYDDKKTKMEIYHYYFSKNKLIKWTGNDNNVITVSSANFTDKESELWAETVILLKELKETQKP